MKKCRACGKRVDDGKKLFKWYSCPECIAKGKG
jgi:predicted RNA-binding Zn-ribbon protein involved in translation (DUF1610 family)